MSKKFLSLLFFSMVLTLQHVYASEFKEGFGRIASSSTELDKLNSKSHVFYPVVVAASIELPTIDTSFVQHSPEGVSLCPFSPWYLKEAAILQLKKEKKIVRNKKRFNKIPRIKKGLVMIETDNEEWHETARDRRNAFVTGKF